MIITEIHPSRAEAQKPSKTNCHRHSICVTSMTRNYMMKGFPPLQVNLKTIAEIAFSLFSIYFVLWWLQNPAQREIQVVRYQTDESQVPHVDTSTLLAQRCTKHISLALFLYCPYLRNITSTSLELQIQLVKSCKGIVVKINLRHFLAISHWLTMRRCHNVALLERFWWPHMLPKSGL